MSRMARFLGVLVTSLTLMTWIGYAVLNRTTREWFERDITLRSRLAVTAAHDPLVVGWGGPTEKLGDTLSAIARDERILGAAACSNRGRRLAATSGFPDSFVCADVVASLDASEDRTASSTVELPSGPVHVSAVPLDADAGRLGAVVLVHDLGYVTRRDAKMRRMLLVAFFALALAASVMTLVAVRLAWRSWTNELRKALTGRAAGAFAPLVRDVRELAERLSQEHDPEARDGAWSPERLKNALTRHLRGERIVILANREPYIHERTPGGIRVVHPASGLVTALEPVMRACSGVWVAHGSGSADRETVDSHDRVAVPPGDESYSIRRVWLSEEEESGYYYGFSNEGLWPLCHVAHARPVFRESDWRHYVEVNRRFAKAVVSEVDVDDPIVLVQDYHFALAPRMIREKLPRATILTFWHVPWPNAERFGICPWRERVLDGLLGSSIVGFHTRQHCMNFVDSVDSFMESRIDRESNAVVQGPRTTLVRPYPISIEWPVHWLDQVPGVEESRRGVRAELGLSADALVGVGVDRVDYTKGIEERLMAVDDLLERHPEFRGRFTFVQLGAPSRTKIPRYQELSLRIEALVEDINARWAQGSYRPIVMLRSHHDPSAVYRFFRAADMCYVSSLHDGMNLVAKEFVAARDDEQGVLVLSQFTGAARDLTEALVVNPYDLRQASDAIAAALRMPPEERRVRMRSMRRIVARFNVYRWAGRMLVDAAELRRKERMTGRFRAPLRSFTGDYA
ncbi:MAG: trehalose-6-phosphate synthase [Polyangiaceae bacterium]